VRTQAEFEAMFNCKAPAGKRYFQHTKLADIVGAYPMTSGLDDQAALQERQQRESFLDFLLGILDLDPTCRSALVFVTLQQHPAVLQVHAGLFVIVSVSAVVLVCSGQPQPMVYIGYVFWPRSGLVVFLLNIYRFGKKRLLMSILILLIVDTAKYIISCYTADGVLNRLSSIPSSHRRSSPAPSNPPRTHPSQPDP